MKRIYDHPHYYDIAFNFRDIPHEVDVFKRCIELFSDIPVHSMLELGCGPAPHAVELMRQGYEYTGIDLNEKMLDYAGARAEKSGYSPELLKKDMNRFSLDRQVDFAFVLLGSLFAANTTELFSHFECVATALRRGGIYLLDWCVQFDEMTEREDSWETEQDDIRVATSFYLRPVDPVDQTFEENIRMKVEDHGKTLEFEENCVRRAIYPQDFLSLIEQTGHFEFVGWWNNWSLDEPIGETRSDDRGKEIVRPITVIRRI